MKPQAPEVFSWLHLKKWASQGSGGVECIFVYLRFAILYWLMVKLWGFPLVPQGCVKVIHCLLFLFILVMETLSRVVNNAVDMGFLKGFHITNVWSESMLTSHLPFAGDTLFLGKSDKSNLEYLRCILLLLKAIFGLRVNLAESVLIPIREVLHLHLLAQFFGCGVDFLPIFLSWSSS